MKLIEIVASSIYDYLNEINSSNNEEIQQLIDIISIDPSKYGRYIEILKTKHNIDFYDYYNDETFLNSPSLSDIKSKEDFLNFDNYIEYARKIFQLRKINLPTHIDKSVDFNEVARIGKLLGFKTKVKEYSGSGNYASFDLVDTITTPKEVDVNTLIHEIGHFFDHNYSKDYVGLAKTITHASSHYYIDKSNEVFAENFLHYFIAPDLLKRYLPEVYEELDRRIDGRFKTVIYGLLK